PAISPMTRKVMLQLSISSFSFLRDRMPNSDSSLFVYSCLRQLTQLAPYSARNREESTAKSQQRLGIGKTRKAEQTFRKGHLIARTSYASRITSCASLSSLNPTNLECLRCPSGVHSVNSICAISLRLEPHAVFHLLVGMRLSE